MRRAPPHSPSQGLTFLLGEITRAIMALFHFLSRTHSIIVGLAITATSLSEKGRLPALTDDQKYCPAQKVWPVDTKVLPLDTKVLPGPKSIARRHKSIAQQPKVLPSHQKSLQLHHLTRYFDGDISHSSSGQIPPHYSWNNDKTRSDQNSAIRQ